MAPESATASMQTPERLCEKVEGWKQAVLKEDVQGCEPWVDVDHDSSLAPHFLEQDTDLAPRENRQAKSYQPSVQAGIQDNLQHHYYTKSLLNFQVSTSSRRSRSLPGMHAST